MKICAASKLIGILFKLYEIPSKQPILPMAGLNRKVYLRIPEDYKGVGALKSCIYRSFITSLWCGFFIEAMARVWHQRPRAVAFFFSEWLFISTFFFELISMQSSVIRLSIESQIQEYLLQQQRFDPVKMPDITDMEACWESIAEAYMPDGVREFAQYPMASLGWMMYVGMAVAKFWDTDWERYSKEENLYLLLRNMRGYDAMDEAIAEQVLRVGKPEQERIAKIVMHCAQIAYDAITRSGIEPSTPQAFVAYADALHALYAMGAATQLHAMGYRMKPM